MSGLFDELDISGIRRNPRSFSNSQETRLSSNHPNDESDSDDENPLFDMPSSTSSNDLRKQLHDLEKKFNHQTIQPVISKRDTEPPIHMPFSMIPTNKEKNNTIGGSGDLMTVNSSSANPKSASHNHLVPKSSDKTVDFLGDLSDGLLVESRKLTYENREYRKKLKLLTSENETMKQKISNLTVLQNKLSSNEESLNDQIWELQSKLGNLEKSLDKSNNDLNNCMEENTNSKNLIEQLNSKIESLNNEKQSILSESNDKIKKLNSRLSELIGSNDNLNDENDILHKTILSLKSELEINKAAQESSTSHKNTENTSFSDFDDSIVYDPLPKEFNEDIQKLDIKSLQNNLRLSYNQISKLRNQNFKFRKEMLKYKKSSPSKLEGKENTSLRVDDENSWGNFEDDSFNGGQPSMINIIPAEFDSALIEDDTASDEENEFNIIATSSSPNSRKSSFVNRNQSYMLIVPKTTLDSNSIDTAKINDIDISKFEAIALPDQIADELLTKSTTKIDNVYFNGNLHLVSSDAIESMNVKLSELESQVENPSVQYLEHKCDLYDLVPLDSSEYKSLSLDVENSHAKVNELEKLHAETLLSLVEKEKEIKLLNMKLQNPEIDYIKEKSTFFNLVPVDKSHYAKVNERTVELEAEVVEISKSLTEYKTKFMDQLSSYDKLLKEKIDVEEKLVSVTEKLDASLKELAVKTKQINQLSESAAENKRRVDELENMHSKASEIIISKSAQIDTLSENNTDLQEKILALSTKHDEVKDTLETKHKEIESVLQDNEKLSKFLESLKLDHSNVKNDLESKHKKVSELSVNNKELDDAINLLTEKHDAVNLELKLKNDKIEDLIAQNSSLEDSLNSLTKRYNELDLQLISKLNLVEELNNSNLTLGSDYQTLKAEHKSLSNLLAQTKKDYDDAVNLKSTLQELHQSVSEKYDALLLSCESFKLQLAEKSQEIALLNEEKNTDQLLHQTKQGELNDINIKLNASLDEMAEKFNVLNADLKSKTFEIEGNESKISDLSGAITDLESSVETWKSKYDNIQLHLLSVESELNQKETELQKARGLQDSLKQQLDECDIKIESSESNFKELEKQMNKLQTLYDSPDAEYISSKCALLNLVALDIKELEKYKKQIADLQKSLDQLNTDLEIAESKICDKEAEIAEFSEYKKSSNELIERLNLSVTNLETTVTEYKNKFAEIQKLYNSPNPEYIREKATLHDLTVISIDDFKSLRKSNDSKSVEIENLSAELSALRSDKETISRRNADNDIKLNSLRSDLRVATDDLVSLRNMMNNPEKDYILSKSTVLGLTAIPNHEYNNMKDTLHENSMRLEKYAVREQELDAKNNEVLVLSSLRDELNQTVKSTEIELKQAEKKILNLQSQLANPSLKYIKDKSVTHGLISIPLEKHESLIQELSQKAHELERKGRELEVSHQLNSDLEKQAELQGQKTVSLDLHLSTQKELESTKEDLANNKKEVQRLKDVEMELNKKEQELNEMSKELESLESRVCLVDGLNTQLSDLQLQLAEKADKVNELIQQRLAMQEKLSELEGVHGKLEVISQKLKLSENELNSIRDMYENPNVAYIDLKARKLGYITILAEDHEINKASLAKLEEKTQQNIDLNLLVSQSAGKIHELQKMNDKLAMDAQKLEELTELYNNPSVKYIKDKSASLGLVALPTADHDYLTNQVSDFSMELDAAQTKIKKIELENKSLQDKIKTFETPSVEYIKSKSTSLGIIPLSILEYNNHKSELERKVCENKNQLQEIEALKLEVTSKKNELKSTLNNLDQVTALLENPSMDYLKAKIITFKASVIKDDELIELKSSREELSKIVEDLKVKLFDFENKLAQKNDLLIDSEMKSKNLVEELHLQLAAAEAKCTQHEKTINENEENSANMSSRLLQLSSSLANAEEKLREKDEKLTKISDEHFAQIDKLKSDLAAAQDLLTITEKKLLDYENNSAELTANIELLENKLLISESKSVEQANTFSTTKNEYLQSVEKLNVELENLRKELAKREDSLKEALVHSTALESDIKGLKSKLTEAEAKLLENDRVISETATDHNAAMEALNSQLILSQKEIADTKILLSQSEKNIGDLTSSIAEIESQLLEKESKLAQSEKLAATATEGYLKSIDTLKQEIATLESKYTENSEMLVKSNEKCDELASLIDRLTAKLNDTETELHEKTDLLTESKHDYTKMSDDMKLKLSGMETQLKVKEEMLTELSLELKSTIAKHQSEISALNDKADRKEHLYQEEFQKMELQLQNTRDTHIEELKALSTERDLISKKHETAIEAMKMENFDDTKLYEVASNRGFAIIPNSANFMQKSSSVATVTSENVHDVSNQNVEAAAAYLENVGYSVLTLEKYQEISEKAKRLDNHMDDLNDVTHEAADIQSDLESKKSLLEELESQHSIRSSASSIQSEYVPVATVLENKAEKINNKISYLAIELQNLKQERDVLSKQLNRLSVSSVEFGNITLSETLSKKLTKIENKLEFKLVELESQRAALTAVHSYIEKSKGMDLPSVMPETIVKDNDTEIVTLQTEINSLQEQYDQKKAKIVELTDEINRSTLPSHMVDQLMLLGYEVIAPSTLETYTNSNKRKRHDSISQQELEALADKQGYKLISNEEASRINSLFSIDEIPFSQIKATATKLGYCVVKKEEWKALVDKSAESKAPQTVAELQAVASSMSLRVISDDDISRLKRRKITTKEMNDKAEELQLTLLTKEEFERMSKRAPITKENIMAKAKSLGYLCISANRFVATTVCSTPDPENVTVLPNSFYNVLIHNNKIYKQNKHKLTDSTMSTPPIPENDVFSPVVSNVIAKDSKTMDIHLPAVQDSSDLFSLASIDTVLSGNVLMTRLIMETNAGEYLYKYYRKMGPLSSISNGRHQRYFWLHPFTLTLYWSVGNPSDIDPAKAQIKALAVVAVESVYDNSPLPPGLYYKSIVVKSYEKTIKVTCPTRKIHNIWFNTLKYLLEKSTANLIDDDKLEDQYLQDFSLDKKTEIERSHSFRHTINSKRSSNSIRPESARRMNTSLRSMNQHR